MPPLRRTAAIVLAMLSILWWPPRRAKPGSGNSTGSAACENGGYLNYTRVGGTTFKNEGDCTKYTAKGGVLVLIDRIAPTVTNVTSSTADGTYGTGASISVQVVFSETVAVTGNPVLSARDWRERSDGELQQRQRHQHADVQLRRSGRRRFDRPRLRRLALRPGPRRRPDS